MDDDRFTIKEIARLFGVPADQLARVMADFEECKAVNAAASEERLRYLESLWENRATYFDEYGVPIDPRYGVPPKP